LKRACALDGRALVEFGQFRVVWLRHDHDAGHPRGARALQACLRDGVASVSFALDSELD
jgi:hypothetical protein